MTGGVAEQEPDPRTEPVTAELVLQLAQNEHTGRIISVAQLLAIADEHDPVRADLLTAKAETVMALRMHDVQFERANRIEAERDALKAALTTAKADALREAADAARADWRLVVGPPESKEIYDEDQARHFIGMAGWLRRRADKIAAGDEPDWPDAARAAAMEGKTSDEH